jgi:hypothetical protein
MINITWASAIKNRPDFKKLARSIGYIAPITNDPSFDTITCLYKLGDELDPIIIFIFGIMACQQWNPMIISWCPSQQQSFQW